MAFEGFLKDVLFAVWLSVPLNPALCPYKDRRGTAEKIPFLACAHPWHVPCLHEEGTHKEEQELSSFSRGGLAFKGGSDDVITVILEWTRGHLKSLLFVLFAKDFW